MSSEDPIVLRHSDARGQAILFGAFAVFLLAVPLGALLVNAAPKWWLVALLPVGFLAGYSALRLATLRVVLDQKGIMEPAPLRPTVLTPWDDMVRVRRTEDKGSLGLSFLGVAVEHTGGWKHQVVALNINTRNPRAEETIDEWLKAIREAKRRHSSSSV